MATDGLLAAIIERPDDDGLRRIFADRCDESGDVALAEFVRIQLELAWYELPSGMSGRQDALIARAHELLKANAADWLPHSLPGRVSFTVSPDEPLVVLYWGDGEYGNVDLHYRRGFVDSVALPLGLWTGGVGASLVRAAPLLTVRVTDRKPDLGFWWYRGTHPSGLHPQSDLPDDVFDMLRGGDLLPWDTYDRRYDTEAAALADLSAALLRLVKGGDT